MKLQIKNKHLFSSQAYVEDTTNVYSFTLPFSGWKESGLGREGGIIESLNDYTELKAISIGG